jgi:hypothetical protein
MVFLKNIKYLLQVKTNIPEVKEPFKRRFHPSLRPGTAQKSSRALYRTKRGYTQYKLKLIFIGEWWQTICLPDQNSIHIH